MVGWSLMDRVIDAPVYRDILTWNLEAGLVRALRFRVFLSRAPYICLRVLVVSEGCGLLADGHTCQSINHSGIRRDRACLSGSAGCW